MLLLIILVFTWIIIASTYLAIKISIDTIPPLLISGIRYTISGLMLFFIFKVYSLEIFDNKKRKKEKVFDFPNLESNGENTIYCQSCT